MLRATVQNGDALSLEDAPKRSPPHRPQIVITQHRDDRNANGCQALSGSFRLHNASGIGQITRHEQEIRLLTQISQW